jgi:hypothetical protein
VRTHVVLRRVVLHLELRIALGFALSLTFVSLASSPSIVLAQPQDDRAESPTEPVEAADADPGPEARALDPERADGALHEQEVVPPPAYDEAPPSTAERERAARREAERDSDGDGLSDALERATGTRALRADTDRDGVPDGEEDTNLDGRVDPGESDPRVPGLFPGAAPHLPEPMSFDLVRGLGSHAGELETNVLVTMRPRRGGLARTTWAPEVEWAFADGLAIELELPMVDREVHALKAAFQWTAPSPNERFAHGAQVIGEYLLDEEATEITGLYLFGARLGSFAAFAMVGARGVAAQGGHVEIVANPSVFVDVHEAVTLGVEGNAAFGLRGGRSGAALAQLHWQIARRFRVQIGGGIEVEDGEVGAAVVTRWILE